MTQLNIDGKEYSIEFAYEPTLKAHVVSRIMDAEKGKGMAGMEDMLLFLPEFLLVGLQKYHKSEFGYNYTTSENKEEQLEKMFGLIEKFGEENENIAELYAILTKEMVNNSFLHGMMKAAAESARKAAKNRKS